MHVKKFVIGIDGGGTKTVGIMTDLHGTVLTTASAGRSNVQLVGAEAAAMVVMEVIEKCCSQMRSHPTELHALVVGLAGAGRESDQKKVSKEIRSLLLERFRLRGFQNLLVESDARIALEGALGGEAGIVLICGTGSIGMAKDYEGNIHRVGGWGRVMGDEGSGYAIGQEALVAIMKFWDGRGESTRLVKAAAKVFHFSSPEAVISQVYRNHFDLSSLAPLVFRAAEKGDLVARRILDKASIELTEHVRVLLGRVDGSRKSSEVGKVKIALLGGLLERPSYLAKRLRRRIVSLSPSIRFQQSRNTPAYGAVLLALKHFSAFVPSSHRNR